MNATVLFTTKNQVIASLRGTIMTSNNGWEILTDVKYARFSEDTCGLGSDYTQPINDSWNFGGIQIFGVEGPQPLDYRHVRLHVTALKELKDNIYVGVGYHLDDNFDIRDERLNLQLPNPVITSHYAYSRLTRYNYTNYITSATSFNLVYDSRDHTVNSYGGRFFQASYRVASETLGSDQNSEQLYLEARYYLPLEKLRPRHLTFYLCCKVILSAWVRFEIISSGYHAFIAGSISPVSESQMAMKRVDSNREHTITTTEVIGTERNMPSMPHIIPQKVKAISTPSGLKFKERPMILGSSTLPTSICTTSMARNTHSSIQND